MLFGFDLNRSDPYSLLLSSPSLSKFSPSKGSFFTSHVHQTLVNFYVIYGTFATFSWLSPFSMLSTRICQIHHFCCFVHFVMAR